MSNPLLRALNRVQRNQQPRRGQHQRQQRSQQRNQQLSQQAVVDEIVEWMELNRWNYTDEDDRGDPGWCHPPKLWVVRKEKGPVRRVVGHKSMAVTWDTTSSDSDEWARARERAKAAPASQTMLASVKRRLPRHLMPYIERIDVSYGGMRGTWPMRERGEFCWATWTLTVQLKP